MIAKETNKKEDVLKRTMIEITQELLQNNDVGINASDIKFNTTGNSSTESDDSASDKRNSENISDHDE